MPSLRGMVFVVGAVGLAFAVTIPASAQLLNRLPPARAPCSVLSGRPCHPSFCGVFHAGPCFPQYLPPIGEDLRLTIVSTDDTAAENQGGASGKTSANSEAEPEQKPLELDRRVVRRAAGLLGAAAQRCGAPRHGIHHPLCLKAQRRDRGAALRYLCEPRRCGEGARHLSRCGQCRACPLHAAAFQRWHGRGGRRPPDRSPLCR